MIEDETGVQEKAAIEFDGSQLRSVLSGLGEKVEGSDLATIIDNFPDETAESEALNTPDKNTRLEYVIQFLSIMGQWFAETRGIQIQREHHQEGKSVAEMLGINREQTAEVNKNLRQINGLYIKYGKLLFDILAGKNYQDLAGLMMSTGEVAALSVVVKNEEEMLPLEVRLPDDEKPLVGDRSVAYVNFEARWDDAVTVKWDQERGMLIATLCDS